MKKVIEEFRGIVANLIDRQPMLLGDFGSFLSASEEDLEVNDWVEIELSKIRRKERQLEKEGQEKENEGKSKLIAFEWVTVNSKPIALQKPTSPLLQFYKRVDCNCGAFSEHNQQGDPQPEGMFNSLFFAKGWNLYLADGWVCPECHNKRDKDMWGYL